MTQHGANRRKLASEALDAIKASIQAGVHDHAYGVFTTSDEYVALDIARCTLEAIGAGVNPVSEADSVVRRYRHTASPWSAARA
jgi:hypothetical protein